MNVCISLCRLCTLRTTDELCIFLFGIKAEAATAADSSLLEAAMPAASGLLEDRLTPPPTPEVQLLVSSGGLARDELTLEKKKFKKYILYLCGKALIMENFAF
jgi:hypothetical protein